MRQSLLVFFPVLLASAHALAATAAGSGALALAAQVGEQSPLLPPQARTELGRLLDGRTRFPYPAHSKIEVRADAVVCRTSDVDISLHTCDLGFGKRKVSVNGRAAQGALRNACGDWREAGRRGRLALRIPRASRVHRRSAYGCPEGGRRGGLHLHPGPTLALLRISRIRPRC